MVITSPITMLIGFVVIVVFISNVIHWSRVSALLGWNLTMMTLLVLSFVTVVVFPVPIFWAKAMEPKIPVRKPYYDNSDNWGV